MASSSQSIGGAGDGISPIRVPDQDQAQSKEKAKSSSLSSVVSRSLLGNRALRQQAFTSLVEKRASEMSLSDSDQGRVEGRAQKKYEQILGTPKAKSLEQLREDYAKDLKRHKASKELSRNRGDTEQKINELILSDHLGLVMEAVTACVQTPLGAVAASSSSTATSEAFYKRGMQVTVGQETVSLPVDIHVTIAQDGARHARIFGPTITGGGVKEPSLVYGEGEAPESIEFQPRQSKAAVKEVQREIQTMQTVEGYRAKNPEAFKHIVKFRGVTPLDRTGGAESKARGYLAEYVPHSVIDVLRAHPDLDQKLAVATQAAAAYTSLHSEQLYHCDGKLDNARVTDEGRLVLTDFDKARDVREAIRQKGLEGEGKPLEEGTVRVLPTWNGAATEELQPPDYTTNLGAAEFYNDRRTQSLHKRLESAEKSVTETGKLKGKMNPDRKHRHVYSSWDEVLNEGQDVFTFGIQLFQIYRMQADTTSELDVLPPGPRLIGQSRKANGDLYQWRLLCQLDHKVPEIGGDGSPVAKSGAPTFEALTRAELDEVDGMDQGIKDMIMRCLDPNVLKRPRMWEVLEVLQNAQR